jgi:Tol biopolymer transport system component
MLRPEDPLGHTLRADAHRELDRYEEAINGYNKAIDYTSSEDPQLVDLYDRRRETYIQMGSFQEALLDAKKCVSLAEEAEEKEIYHTHVFTALVSLGLYEEAKAKYSELYDSLPENNTTFWLQCAKYVVETLEAGRQLSLSKTDASEAAFLPMLETEKIYRDFKAKGKRLITDGWSASWSPDGAKLAYTKGVIGVSGIAVYDLRSQQTELLFVPGKDPVYSPDGQYIAFVRDRQILPLGRLATSWEQPINFWEHVQPKERGELWLMNADGSKPRRLARGQWFHWSPDSKSLFYHSVSEQMLYSIPVNDAAASPTPVSSWSTSPPTLSLDGEYMAYAEGNLLTILDLSSRQIVDQWLAPMAIEVKSWAPNGPQLHMPAWDGNIGVAGLWIYDFEQNDVTKILSARIGKAGWSPDKKKLAMSLGEPLYDIWIVDTDLLSPGQTLKEYLRERAKFHNRLAEADPCDADRHLFQAAYYQYLADPNSLFSGQKRYAELFFGQPTNLGPPVNTSSGDISPFISADGLSLYFASTRAAGRGGYDLWMTTRDTIDDEWGPCTNPGPTVNSSSGESAPRISADGLSLYFDSNRGGGCGGWDLWMTTRETTSDPWGDPCNLGPTVNSPADESCPSITADGLELYFGEWDDFRPGGSGYSDLWVTKRPTKDEPWGTPVNLGDTVNSSYPEGWPFISADGLKLYFSSNRAGGYGSSDSIDIWVTTRARTDSPWTKPANLGPTINSPFHEGFPSLSANGSTLYFGSDRPGGSGHWDLWQAPDPHWPDDSEAPGGADQAEILPKASKGKEVVPDTDH